MSDMAFIKGVVGSGGGKSGGGGARTPVEAPDSLRSKQIAKVLDLICEGEIEGFVNGLQSIYFNETPLQAADGSFNFTGVSVDYRLGSQDQTYIAGFDSQESETQVGVEMLFNQPVIRSINNLDANAVRVTIGIPALSFQDLTNGDVSGTSVQLAIDVQSNGTQYVTQALGTDWTAISLAPAPATASTPSNATGVQGVVQWRKPLISASSGTSGGESSGTGGEATGPVYAQAEGSADAYVAISFNVEYRLSGAASWTVLSTTSLYSTADGSLYASGGNGAATFSVGALPAGTYDVRVRQTSSATAGTLYLGSLSYLTSVGYDTITGKASSRYQRSYLIPLPGTGPWNVRVRRLTADSTQTNLQNQTWWDSYTDIVDAKLRYPNSAIVGISIDASQFDQIPDRAYDLKLMRVRVPSNYDPIARTYTGTWDGTFKVAWTDNPAWGFYDMATSTRYGLGDNIPEALIDKWSLYTIAKYCDEMVPDGRGGWEPRFTLNVYIQTQAEAYKVLNDLASVFRGMLYWATDSIYAVQDAPADPEVIFNQANVIGGAFNREGSDRKARHTVAVVTWNDPNNFYKTVPEYVVDDAGVKRYGVRKSSVVAFGCTSQGQAHRVGRWLLYTERYESETITFSTGLDATYVRPGQIIKIVDPGRSTARWGGRIIAAADNSVTIDSEVSLDEGVTYTLSVMAPDGSMVDRILTNAAGPATVLTFDTALDSTDIVQHVWCLGQPNLEPELLRVIGMSDSDDGDNTYKITALQHYPGKFAAVENNLKLQIPKTSDLKIIPNQVSNLAGSEYLYKEAGAVRTRLVISYAASSNAVRYSVSYKRSNGNWTMLPPTSATEVEVNDVVPDTYTLRVVSISALGKMSQPITATYTVKGKAGIPPSDVTGFTATKEPTLVKFSWDDVPDLDLGGYEIRQGASWDSGIVLTTGLSGTSFLLEITKASTYYFHIKAIDTSGNYSANATTVKLVLVAPPAVEDFFVVQVDDRLEFHWDKIDTVQISNYEVREGDSWGDSILIANINSTVLTIPSGVSGTRKFWIKAIAFPGVYADIATWVSTAIVQPPDRNVILTDDEATPDFPSIKHLCHFLDDGLVMDDSAPLSEYDFKLSLGYQAVCQVSLLKMFSSIASDTDTWETADFTWDSPDAQRPWEVTGDYSSITVTFQIATDSGLPDDALEAWPLDQSLTGLNGTAAANSTGADYADGRFSKGLLVDPTVTVDWDYAVPAEFSQLFWLMPNSANSAVYWRATGDSGKELKLSYSKGAQSFSLMDDQANLIEVPFDMLDDDMVCVGIIQESAQRSLFVGRFGEAPVGVTKPYAANGAYTNLALH